MKNLFLILAMFLYGTVFIAAGEEKTAYIQSNGSHPQELTELNEETAQENAAWNGDGAPHSSLEELPKLALILLPYVLILVFFEYFVPVIRSKNRIIHP